ncbi:helix-turn-helix domain-containing protein [Paenibacillus aurantius]|uniref:Helix-turn-helix domain-containing protein n=1 Tax=Paenibacillus aurantius TaxID=2918900 RepID=A0AA96LFQ3_9BACL|nr:helix-turn-helix domain-containing protein [Paenibacillus aurantius]WJH32786.1 MarR family transcriptional regulator [Paenibacillus sp. CC-CFT747]WNQ13194.1 helix-turn-helix domain-containing protein [Paenibacillus aurantius]
MTKTSFLIGKLIHQIRRRERQPRTFGTGGALTPSEMHTIDAIGSGHGILMSELADRLGVTKGAVSQIVERLESKDLVLRTPNPQDSRSVTVGLKEKGLAAYHAHEELYVKRFDDWITTELSREELQSFEKGVKKLIEFLEE